MMRGYEIRLKNRRVRGFLMEDGSLSWGFKRLMPDGTIMRTKIAMSREAFMAMVRIADDLLNGKG